MSNVKQLIQPPALDHDAMMLTRFGHHVSPNGKLERRIAWNFLEHMRILGFNVTELDDGEEVTKVTDSKSVMELLFNLDEAHVYFRKPGFKMHWVFFVLGNGTDILSDASYTPADPDGFMKAFDEFDAEDYA